MLLSTNIQLINLINTNTKIQNFTCLNTKINLSPFLSLSLPISLSKPTYFSFSKEKKIETVKRWVTPFFFPDHLVRKLGNGNRVTRCRGVSATAWFPNFRNNGVCRIVVPCAPPSPHRSQRDKCQRERETRIDRES